MANKKYSSKKDVIKNYQKVISKDTNLSDEEQFWVDENLIPLIDFMGDEDVWISMIPKVQVQGAQGRASSRKLPITPYPIAVFSGAHWTSRKANESLFFDPYDHYQIKGTNQFCQTFAMMFLADALPLPLPDGWERNYEYARNALQFIKNVISFLDPKNDAFNKLDDYGNPVASKKKLLKCVEQCLKYPNICVNAIEYPII